MQTGVPSSDGQTKERGLRRVEARSKVTGTALYTGDFGSSQIKDDLLYAALVQSTVAAGRIAQVDITGAADAPGVRAIITHRNAPRLQRVKTLTSGELDSFLPLQDDCVHYHGQPIAMVVASTPAHAAYAASLISAKYEITSSAVVSFDEQMSNAAVAKKVGGIAPARKEVGEPETAFSRSPVQLDLTFATAAAHHNAMEPGACIAAWDPKGRLRAWSATQFVYGDAMALGEAFGFGVLDRKARLGPQLATGRSFKNKVRVIAPLVGGAFGSKTTGTCLILAAMAAKVAGMAVKLVLTRQQTYALMPFRSATRQRIRAGAELDGTLCAILHEATIQMSKNGAFVEPVGEVTPHLYACKHIATTHKVAMLDISAPGFMRAPGVAPGLFGLESMMDELAESLGIDPLDLRLRNYAEADPETGKPWSSKSLKECYLAAAERIGWRERDPRPCSMSEDDALVGYGMASAMYPVNHFPAVVKMSFDARGKILVETAIHEIGQGAITALTQIAAESLGLAPECIHFRFGDTELPFGFITAGSSTLLSTGTAIKEAAQKLLRQLILRAITDKASPLNGCSARVIRSDAGRLYHRDDWQRGESYFALLARHPKRRFETRAVTGRTFGRSPYARFSFGSQFVKVAVHPDTGQVRVRQAVGAFACGRIINPVLARSQLMGGMVWGIGQALFEESSMDTRNGCWVTSNLADALVPTNSDVADLEVLLIEENDERGSSLGAKGIGEIGITGVAAAISNAVFHATGRRVRELPIRLEKLMGSASLSAESWKDPVTSGVPIES